LKLLDGNLYLEFADAIECGMDGNYLRKAKSTGAKAFTFVDDPEDRRKVLIEYESLKPHYKEQVKQRFGDPYEALAKEPIKKMIVKDVKAEEYYMQYRYDGCKMLPIERVKEYTAAASWLNMLKNAHENKKEIKKLLNLSVADFFVKVSEIIKQENIGLPGHYVRLKEKIKQYSEEGYPCLINKQFGNNNAKKVADDIAESTLLEMIANHNQFDDVFIAFQYKKWAEANNYEPITPATVGNYRRKNLAAVITEREGRSAFNETFIRQVKGLRPQSPLSLVEHDDNNLDFLFADETNYKYNKYVSIVVMDSCTKLVLGYSYALGRSPQQWQVHHAYLNAMYYIKQLTGGWYLPFEIKSDRWAHKSLSPFYNRIALNITPAHGNKHRGYIEQLFGSDHWKRCQKLVSNGNWSGNNMTAKYRGVNEDVLRMNESYRPMIGTQAEQQIENFFHLLRTMPDIKRTDMDAASREEMFLQKWNTLSEKDKRPITDEQFMLTFGIKHNSISITNRGVEPQINNTKFSYDLPEQWMYNKLVGEKVEVYYDPFDFSRILVTNHKDIRFIAQSATLIPRATKDACTNSRTFLNGILEDKKQQVRDVTDDSFVRKVKVGALNQFNAEGMLQGGVLVKEDKYIAEQAMIEEDYSNEQEQFLNDNYDLNQFFNNQSLSA
jgi:hypothetical protein